MKTRFRRFNIYFALAAAFLSGGCGSVTHEITHGKKEMTTIRLYLEGGRVDTGDLGKVLVTRDKYPYMVEREPFLTEADVTKAALVEDGEGSYSIQVAFNDHGTLLLDMITTSNKGKHIIIFSQFPIPGEKQPKPKRQTHNKDIDDDFAEPPPPPPPPPEIPGKPRQSGWLTAVLIRDRNSSGIFRFSPDASHEEGARIVRGLKNVIAASKRAEKMQL
jgi:hypothetical protein